VRRLGPLALPILLMIAGFRMPGYISNAMALPLFKSLHYSDTDIATVTKLFGFWVALGATFFSSYVILRIGMMPSLLLGTVAGSAAHLSLAWLSAQGSGGFWIFAVAVSIEGFAYAFAQVVLINYMLSIAGPISKAIEEFSRPARFQLPGRSVSAATPPARARPV
jgi:PAT family beta-lactamase induction signal transducer AmpG